MDMRWLTSIAILLMVVFAFSPVKSAEADDFSFSIGFHDELSPYGTWMNYSSYGNVWRPYNYSSFHPYSDGYWGYTNYGPTWYGNEPYASYVYHYGNWIYTPNYGWVWIPGTSWHAGRVNWSYGGGYIGWRPQFPSGYNYGYGNDYNFWVVIDSDRFGYNSYRPYRLDRNRVRDLFQRRVFRERYDTFRRADLERIVRRPVRVLNVRERTARIGDRRARMLVTSDDEVRIRRNVSQVRGRGNDRRTVERETVMKRKFDDIRTKSSNQVRRSDNDRRTEVRRSEVRRPDVREKQRIEKSKPSNKKVITSKQREVQKKSKTVVKPSSRKPDRDNDRLRRTSSSSRKTEVERAVRSSRKPSTVERSSRTVRKPAKVESSTRTVRKSEVKSTRGPSKSKAQVSTKRTTKKESSRKPPKRKN
jgi:hypothetical protein